MSSRREAKPTTAAERKRIADDLRAGMSRNDAMRKYQRGAGVVTKIAKTEGISLKREMIAAATEARAIDLRAKLAIEAEGYLEDIQRFRKKLFSPGVTFKIGGGMNVYTEHPVLEPSPSEQQQLVQAIGTLTDRILKVTATDSPGSEEAKGMIVDLVEAAQTFVAAEKAKEPDVEEPEA